MLLSASGAVVCASHLSSGPRGWPAVDRGQGSQSSSPPVLQSSAREGGMEEQGGRRRSRGAGGGAGGGAGAVVDRGQSSVLPSVATWQLCICNTVQSSATLSPVLQHSVLQHYCSPALLPCDAMQHFIFQNAIANCLSLSLIPTPASLSASVQTALSYLATFVTYYWRTTVSIVLKHN